MLKVTHFIQDTRASAAVQNVVLMAFMALVVGGLFQMLAPIIADAACVVECSTDKAGPGAKWITNTFFGG